MLNQLQQRSVDDEAVARCGTQIEEKNYMYGTNNGLVILLQTIYFSALVSVDDLYVVDATHQLMYESLFNLHAVGMFGLFIYVL